MIVKLWSDSDDSQVDLENTDFKPPSFGTYLEAAIRRRELSVQSVAQACAIELSQLRDILDDKLTLDKKLARKLEKSFPKCSRLFLTVQRYHDYFEKYHVLRPDSPIKRAIIERRARKQANIKVRKLENA
jgi:plasmid maintenance system antidote protein VapI